MSRIGRDLRRIARELDVLAAEPAPHVDVDTLARIVIGVLLQEFHARRFKEIDVFLSTVGRELVEERLRLFLSEP